MRVISKLILGIAAIAVLVWLLVQIGSFTLDVLGTFAVDSGERDPMFADVAETAVPTPEVEETDGRIYQDNSANWDTSVQTPVDQTAEELGEEARRESVG